MPFRHRLQASRFELKYVIDEECALGVRSFVSSHLDADEHTKLTENNSYAVNSLYLDSPDLTLFRQTACGVKNRFKLRIRFYDGNADHPAFLEIKRRVTDVICKERAAITREGAACLVDGGLPDSSCLVGTNGDPKSGSALQNFCGLYESIGARACIYVSYMREAYVSPDSDQVRVTFDRELRGAPFERAAGFVPPEAGTMPDVGGVILELKFTDRFPAWMRELAQAFNLQRRSVPKYNMCIEAMGLEPPNLSDGLRRAVR
jgi:hypothetical protein